jgi:hypothetical protein
VARILYHYTDERGLAGILATGTLLASTVAKNPRDARHGDGKYLSDIEPGTLTRAQLSRLFLGQPFQGRRFTRYVAIDVDGLPVIEARRGVLVIPGDGPLDLTGRIRGHGDSSTAPGRSGG